jgi:hypothetical protein
MPYTWPGNDIFLPGQPVDTTKLNDAIMFLKEAGGGGAAAGLGNYIAEPFAVTAGTGLQALVAAHRSVIDETLVEATSQQAVTLTGKAAQLIIEDKTGALSVQLPKMAAADIVDANTVGLWFPDGSASVPNAAVGVNGNALAVANALTKNGTFNAVDGWAGGNAGKGDGSTGYYVSANSTGFPAGANVREINFFFTVPTIGANFIPFHYGNTDNSGEGIFITSGGVIAIPANGAIDTGFVVKAGETHLCTVQYDGTHRKVYVGGVLINVTGSGVNTTASVLYVGRRSDNPAGYASAATIHFIELRNALRTPSQIATLAQKLLIPCAYKLSNNPPIFTTYTKDGYTVSTSSEYSGAYAAWMAFDGSVAGSGTAGSSAADRAAWTIELALPRGIAYKGANFFAPGANSINATFVFEGWNGSAWSQVANVTASGTLTASAWNWIPFSNVAQTKYTKYRYRATSGPGDPNGAQVVEIQYVPFVLEEGYTDIRNSLPNSAESQIVSFVKTSATAPTLFIAPSDPQGPTPDWAYGIRIGPLGMLNRRKALGYKLFNSTADQYWDSPFGTRNVDRFAFAAEDSNGRNKIKVPDALYNGSYYTGAFWYGKPNGKIGLAYASGYVNGSITYSTLPYTELVLEVID